MLDPVLIANRGEIAVRVARTVHALGARSVAVYTAVDAAAPHVDAADVAVALGDDPRAYLDVDAVIAAALRTGAAAIHPGYGFLSENPALAAACAANGIAWIGPPPGAIEVMGDKAAAKALARDAGVPVVPGVECASLGAGEIGAFAAEHGFPVVIKAVAGGGGKGMRVVRSAAEVEGALAAARREARGAFGDDRVLVERYLERPRHIEVQVLADRHGNVVHLGERECSLQRRHQKVVEEAPSPVVGEELRARMGAAAVDLARACEYEGAGTVEFIAPSGGGEFFFLEMNTRLQVEHPVTELVYGVDLVEQQLRVAAGEELGLAQDALVPRGWAVEARLYAEDPANGFLPSTGTVRRYREPAGVRFDSGIREGSEVGTSYDPMLAKAIASGADRGEALRRLSRALGELELLGVATNAAFTRALLARDDVRAGELDTGLLERVLAGEEPPPAGGPSASAAAAPAALPDDLLPAAALAAAGTVSPPGPWRRRFEAGEARIRDGFVTIGDRSWAADVRALGDGAFRVALDGLSRRYVAEVTDDAVWIARDGFHLEARTERVARGAAAAAEGALEAPMPGTVLLVNVANGDRVKEGDVLVVLESMKMELSIAAPHDGVVADLDLAVGDRVVQRQALVAVLGEEAAE